MNFTENDRTILSSGIAFFLIGMLVSIIGVMSMYQLFPLVVMPVPTCECPILYDDYNKTRDLFSMIGFFFGLIPMAIWKIKCRMEINTITVRSE